VLALPARGRAVVVFAACCGLGGGGIASLSMFMLRLDLCETI